MTYVIFGRAYTDSDNDGVSDGTDACPGTAIPERVPTQQLGNGRFALVDENSIFDVGTADGPVPSNFTMTRTHGCGCGQILAQVGRSGNEARFGCTLETMQSWTSGL